MKKVRIKDDLRATEWEYGICDDMLKMRGNIYNVDEEDHESYYAGGYYFLKQDCEIVEDEQPIYDDERVSIGHHIITYDFAEDCTPREIATMLLLLQKQGITKQQIRDMANDNKIKVGDKVFVNFTCESNDRASNGVRLDEEMLKYNHTIQVVCSVNDKGCFLKNVPFNYAHEWLTKGVER